jgi:uncharacterized membrane protein
MKIRTLLLVGGVLVLGMLALSAWAWPQIPDGASIPIHWGPTGEADGYGPKWVGLLGLPAAAVAILLVMAVVPRIEPRRRNLERSSTAYVAIGIAVVAFQAALHVFAVLAALGRATNIAPVAEIGIGLLFVVMGNFLGKTRSSWLFGIRTPWTLSSERSWQRTNRLGGYLFMALGLAMILSALLLPPQAFVWLLLGGLLGTVAILVGYSYLVWRDDPDRSVTA